jgi:IS30 family transposase
MGKRYDQLDLDDRIEISRLHAAGKSRREIGHLMGRNASTISRELRRNSLPRGEYKPASADRMALSRRRRLPLTRAQRRPQVLGRRLALMDRGGSRPIEAIGGSR